MIEGEYIERRLTLGEQVQSQSEIFKGHGHTIVLAEPGAGKTELLNDLARRFQTKRHRANIFRSQSHECAQSVLIVDGFDEVAKLNMTAIDDLIVKIGKLSPHRLIIASRSSEWDEVRYSNLIGEALGSRPITVRLNPFDQVEQAQLFESHYPEEKFEQFREQADLFGLSGLLGNPQMLKIFAAAYAQNDRKFEAKKQIFQDAIIELCIEANPDIPLNDRIGSGQLSLIASEVFTKLLLSGSAGLASTERASSRDFPFLTTLTKGESQFSRQILDTKLFKPADDPSTHEPVHRIIAEYCAGSYLAGRINDSSDQLSLTRVLSIVAPNGAVRDELRGLLGWLTASLNRHDQVKCIELSPYAVLSNGDPSQLSAQAKKSLLIRLSKLAEKDPYFRRADRWRTFSTHGFFSHDVIETMKTLLSEFDNSTDLPNLLLEMLKGSDAISSLEPELETILFDSTLGFNTRVVAAQNLASLSERAHHGTIESLIASGGQASLKLAAEIVMEVGVDAAGKEVVSSLLKALTTIYKTDDSAIDTEHESRYFISLLVGHFTMTETVWFLDQLSDGLQCICGKPNSYDCHCRVGISKIIGRLLDHYFELATEPFDPARIWVWVKGLNFRNQRAVTDSKAVNTLQKNDKLRQSIHVLAFEGQSDPDELWEILCSFRLSELHSGLFFVRDDQLAIIDHAYNEDNLGLWSTFCSTHNWYTKDQYPSALRTKLRAHAQEKPEFMKIWAARERSSREARLANRYPRFRSRQKWKKRRAKIRSQNLEHLKKNRAQIGRGEHWEWLCDFASSYLSGSDDILEYIDDPSLPETALLNCFSFLQADVPTLQKIGVGRSKGQYWKICNVCYAACLATFRNLKSLSSVGIEFLRAAKTDINVSHSGMDDTERKAFHGEIDRNLFKTKKDILDFAREYIEPQLSSNGQEHTSVGMLRYDPVFKPAVEIFAFPWLRQYPDMSFSAADTLFDLLAAEQQYSDLRSLIIDRCTEIRASWTYGPPTKQQIETKDFWFVRSFVFLGKAGLNEWKHLKEFNDTIFALSHHYDGFRGSSDNKWPSLDAYQIFCVLDAFVEKWRKTELPSSWGSGSPKGETAYRFLRNIAWKIANDRPNNKIPILEKILQDQRLVEFHNDCRHMLAQSHQQDALRNFSAPPSDQISGLLDHNRVATIEDLRALLVEELQNTEHWFRNIETNPLVSFYENGEHVNENTARDRIVDRLDAKLGPLDIALTIERPMALQNRCDFTAEVSIAGVRNLLVVEVKGQWHRELFSAASDQLYERYSHHPNAADQGIYLVLWFGDHVKIANKAITGITSAGQLRAEIIRQMPDTLKSAIDVVVIDLAR